MSIRKYLADAQRNANEGFANADGFFDDDLSFTANDDFYGADASSMGAPSAPTSQPYIVTITNTGSAVNNFDVLGSFEYINNNGFNASGNLVIGAVTISSAIPNVTYQQMLWQFQSVPYSVGLTYIQSATANQLLETLSINTKDANGNIAQKALIPTLDPYQQQSTVLVMRYGYRIDGYTKIILSSVLASTTVKLYLYPSDNINMARGLSGKAVARDFASPGIVRSQPVKLVG
jgi:hypothetical protein